MKADLVRSQLDLLLLAVLQGKPLHGYAIIERLREQSSGVFDLPEGTVYPALHRLERAGLLLSRWAAHQGRQRRLYELNAEGRKALAEQESHWVAYSHAIHQVLVISR